MLAHGRGIFHLKQPGYTYFQIIKSLSNNIMDMSILDKTLRHGNTFPQFARFSVAVRASSAHLFMTGTLVICEDAYSSVTQI